MKQDRAYHAMGDYLGSWAGHGADAEPSQRGIGGHWQSHSSAHKEQSAFSTREKAPAPVVSCTAGSHSHSWSVFTVLQRTQNGQKKPGSGSASLLVVQNQAFSISNTFPPPPAKQLKSRVKFILKYMH